jgi:hypothetical protein
VITYWTPRDSNFTIREYSEQRGSSIAHHFAMHDYEAIEETLLLTSPAHIFTASDQLSSAGQELVGNIIDILAASAPDWRLLNDPRRTLLRQPFLHAAAAAGLNDFRIHSATSEDSSIRFPVFLRERNRHDGPLTELLDSPAAVRAALRALRLRGHRTRELLQVEYQDTSDEHGRFRKYSAFRVGDRIVRTHMMISPSWSVKSDSNSASIESAVEEREYLSGTAHELWLRQVFDLAHIQWGRIDYGILNGRPQAWEINTCPTIGRRLHAGPRKDHPDVLAIKEEGRSHAHALLRDAFVALESPASSCARVSVSLPKSLLATVRQEYAAAARRERAMGMMREVYHSNVIGWPMRAVYNTIARRR